MSYTAQGAGVAFELLEATLLLEVDTSEGATEDAEAGFIGSGIHSHFVNSLDAIIVIVCGYLDFHFLGGA